jgi:hypothetical protein
MGKKLIVLIGRANYHRVATLWQSKKRKDLLAAVVCSGNEANLLVGKDWLES